MRSKEPAAYKKAEDSLLQRLRSFVGFKIASSRIDTSSFEDIAMIGKGCMGDVYRAREKGAGSFVAIKVAHPRHEAEVAIRNEMKALSRLHHQNIVRLLAAGRIYGEGFNGSPAIVCEYLDGMNLSRAIEGNRILPWELAKPILLDMALALDAVHSGRLVHRDVKPSNIFLSTAKTKLIDFGVCERKGAILHLSQSFTPGNGNYAAPELFIGSTDTRSDIYSLGMVMYRIISGRMPRNPFFCIGGERLDVSGMDAAKASIVLKATEKSAEDRYRNAMQLHAAILAI